MSIQPSIEQVQKAISKAFLGIPQSTVVSITELSGDSFSYTKSNRTYIVDLSASKDSPATHSSFLTVSAAPAALPDPNVTETVYHPNKLQIYTKLISLVKQHTTIPFQDPVLDTSLALIPYPYILTPPHPITSSALISLSSARKQNLLSPQHNAMVDLGLGQMLGQLHAGVLNEWFGLPLTLEPANPSYSWQESFTALLETLLHQAESSDKLKSFNLPYEDLKRYLSRAIAFYIFDDVQVPSLVWFTGSEDDVYITVPSNWNESPSIIAILPNLAHALWGDPLLESFFLPPAPSDALKEAYEGCGGERLIVFPRQKTKRLWYTAFLALVVLLERVDADPENEKRVWAGAKLRECADALKDAPCY
ncbi:aminoglycoside phosphotransferase [Moniliophthora roreri MCA 2997]|uniref:Aminoglycoside phosphotransferase n=2 Tax=Moniliophthora roreri TaxID=221103 RepID=V2YJQ3_MONRO|nr:aminoglycoside phosphotransferase [Moniliophthora roreri MCA 2997]KAI3604985.1 aminoglycoside phosphotransferase [Moniliophthora roreri]